MENIKILVPLDFSDISTQALHSAQVMARLFGGTITPFHSYLPVSDMDNSYMFGATGMSAPHINNYEEIESVLIDRLTDIANTEIEERYLSTPVVAIGNPAQTIAEEADAYDMIVMNTHGRTGFSRFFLGSVAEKVLRLSSVPVLVVNKDRELDKIDRIMLTTDFSERSKEAFPITKEIAQKAQASVELVHVISYDSLHNDTGDESVITLREQRLKVLAKEEFYEIGDLVETKVIVSSGTPHDAIVSYNRNNPHSLIIMSTIGRTGIDYLMMGSTTANVVRHVQSAVLSINPRVKEKKRNSSGK